MDQNQPSLPEVDAYLAQFSWVRHIHAPTPGYASNLNALLQAARGEIVIYLDDDILADPKLVESHLKNYASNQPKLAAVAGRVEQRLGDKPPESITELGRYHRFTGRVVANFNAQVRKAAQVGIGANMSFKKSALLEIGGFDEGFGGNGFRCESDAFLRLGEKGYQIVFDPEAQVKHLMAPSGGCRVPDKAKLNFHFVKNGLRLYRKHSPVALLPFFTVQLFFYSAAKAVYQANPKVLGLALRAISEGLSESIEGHS